LKAIVNGRTMEIAPLSTLLDIIVGRGVKTEGVIASVNDDIVRRDKWSDISIREGDRIELVSLVGGG
jgi:sulfur carrier protein